MNLRDFGLLTDENVHPEAVRFLEEEGFDVFDVNAERMSGAGDRVLLRKAFSENRVLVTHDRDFGRLVIAENVPFIGVLYLRPGHLDPAFTIGTLRAVLGAGLSPEPPFLLVAEHAERTVNMRLRSVGQP